MSSSFKRRGRKATSSSSAAVSPPISSTQNISTTSNAQPSPSQQQRTVSSSNLPGTKPWTNNLTLTSFGLREIDSFFFSSGGEGGGIPLMSLILLEEDRLTDDLARSLCRYWCAEGVSQRQMVLMVSMLPSIDDDTSLKNLDEDDTHTTTTRNYEGSTPQELQDFIHSLPRNLHLDKFRVKEAKKKKKQSSTTDDNTSSMNENQMMSSNNREAISAIIEEEEEEEDDDGNSNTEESNKDEGLVNAWQYRKSVQDKRSGMSGTSNNNSGTNSSASDGVYCHSFDLSKRMSDQFTETGDNPLDINTRIIDCSNALSSATVNNVNMEYQQQGMALFCSLWRHLQSTISTHPNTVIRLFLHRLPVGQGAVALPLLMAKIRKENLPVVVLATIRPWKWLSSASSSPANNNKLDTLASLRSTTDTTLSLDSFSSLRTPPPPEFSLLQGILTVRKCAAFTVTHYTDTVTWKRPLAERFGMKRDGRKVTVQLLHLPPEEYSKGGSSTSGVRSGGGSMNADDNKKKHQHSAGGCSSLAGGASLDF